jgi:hypothetical protein
MAKRHKDVSELRSVIQHIEGAWVRRWGTGEIWAGARLHSTKRQVSEVRDAIESAGWLCSMDGKPGTAGEDIITVNGRAG